MTSELALPREPPVPGVPLPDPCTCAYGVGTALVFNPDKGALPLQAPAGERAQRGEASVRLGHGS